MGDAISASEEYVVQCQREIIREQVWKVEANCDTANDAAKQIKILAKALKAYLQGVAQLSDNEKYRVDTSVDGLVTAAGKAGLSTLTAEIGNLIKPVANQLISIKQQKEIRKHLVARDQDFSAVAKALQGTIEDDFVNILNTESTSIQTDIARIESLSWSNTGPAVVGRYRFITDMATLKQQVDAQSKAATKLGKAIEKLSNAHHELASSVKDFDSKELISQMRVLYTQLKEAHDEFKKANPEK